MDRDRYVENLEELVSELHAALELTVYDIDDADVRGNIVRKADKLWDEYCGYRAKHYRPGET